MLAFCWYMLKVALCSGILFVYYWVFLRNKLFHRYNRFYLMTALVLSLLLPLVKIGFWQPEQKQNQVVRVLQVVSAGDEYMNNLVVSTGGSSWSMQDLYPILYVLISMALLVVMVRTLLLIRSLLKRYPVQEVEDVAFVNTEDRSTPFSFLRYIFWNSSIDINTTTGRQIFKHEVAHIQEKHTHDKLFMNLVLVFFWSNPFFWLYRKELNMIHEFIADQKAVEDSDTAAFAAMILQAAYPRHRFELTNNFFYSPIKRRLLMLAKNNNPKVNYIGRIMVLPLAALIFAAFTFKTKPATAGKDIARIATAHTPARIDTIPISSIFINVKNTDSAYLHSEEFRHRALVIIDSKEIGNLGNEFLEQSKTSYSSIVVYSPEKAKPLFGQKGEYGVIKAAQKEVTAITAKGVFVDDKNGMINLVGPNISLKGNLSSAMICIEGKEATQEELNKIPPEKISSVNIIKGEKLNDYVEAKGKTAMIQVNLKPDPLDEVVVVGHQLTEVKEAEGQPVAIAVDKMNVLYIGVDNPITVAVPGIPSDKLLIQSDQGTINGSNGKYVIHVTTPGEAIIRVLTVRDGRRVLLSSQVFRVKMIPDPVYGKIPSDMDVKYVMDSSLKMQQKAELRQLQEKEKMLRTDKLKEQQLLYLNQKLTSEKYQSTQSVNPLLDAKYKLQETEVLNQKVQYLKQQDLKLAIEKNRQLASTYKVAQDGYNGNGNNLLVTRADIDPSFTGGNEAWQKYLAKNLKPWIAADEGWKPGKYMVMIRFIVLSDGSLADIQAVNYKNSKIANHCIEIIKKSPRWQPAIKDGKKMNAYKMQPITFVIEAQ